MDRNEARVKIRFYNEVCQSISIGIIAGFIFALLTQVVSCQKYKYTMKYGSQEILIKKLKKAIE